MLGFEGNIVFENGQIPQNQIFPEPSILFQKIEDEPIDKEVENLNSLRNLVDASEYTPQKKAVDFDHFDGIDLRVAEILHAEAVPKSKKLLKLTVDLGFEKRTVVSGIAEAFPIPEKLIGKRVALIANLKPRKIMGIESQGMLLSAGGDDELEPLFLSKTRPGSNIG